MAHILLSISWNTTARQLCQVSIFYIHNNSNPPFYVQSYRNQLLDFTFNHSVINQIYVTWQVGELEQQKLYLPEREIDLVEYNLSFFNLQNSFSFSRN